MMTAFRLRTLLIETWKTATSDTQLLVHGLTVGLVTLLENGVLFQFREVFIQSIESHSFSFGADTWLVPFIFTCFLIKTVALSQIFLLAASTRLHRPAFRVPSRRFISALAYIGIEILTIFVILFVSLPAILPFLLDQDITIRPLIKNIALAWVFIMIIFIYTLKRLLIGYFLLSSLNFRSSLNLSMKLFIRHQYPLLCSFFLIMTLILLFTFLENLVMLQGAFLVRLLPKLPYASFMYGILLLLNTFMVVFAETFWLHVFLLLTNKHQRSKVAPLLIREKAQSTPPVL